MNWTEHHMPASGRTRDRATERPGWAGFYYPRERTYDVAFACVLGAALALLLFFGLSGG